METQSVEEVTTTQTAPQATPAPGVQVQTVTRRSGMPLSDFFVSKTNQIIFAFIGIIALLLLLRIIFLLLGANNVGIVSFIYSITQLLVAPFVGIFPAASSGASYFDTAALLAIVIYAVLGVVLGIVVNLFSTRTE